MSRFLVKRFTVEPITETEEGTDRRPFEEGYVAITPLRLDLTDEAALARVEPAVARAAPSLG